MYFFTTLLPESGSTIPCFWINNCKRKYVLRLIYLIRMFECCECCVCPAQAGSQEGSGEHGRSSRPLKSLQFGVDPPLPGPCQLRSCHPQPARGGGGLRLSLTRLLVSLTCPITKRQIDVYLGPQSDLVHISKVWKIPSGIWQIQRSWYSECERNIP